MTRGRTSIQLKIMLWGGLCLVLAAAAIIGYAATSLHNSELQGARDRAMAEARSRAASIDAEVEVPIDTARTLAQSLAAVKARQNPLTATRDQVNTMLIQILENNPDFLGTYTLWEPDAFDGKDDRYINAPGHDHTGRFIPYWNRSKGGRIAIEPSMNYEQEDIGDYYQCPKRTHNECIIEPFIYPVQGEDVLMTSAVAPIMANGQFYGISGVDIRLDQFQSQADEFNLYDGTATLALISYSGKLSAVTRQPDLLGEPATRLLGADFDTTYLLRIQKGDQINEFHTNQGQEQLTIFIPIHFGHTTRPWSLSLIIPAAKLTEQATHVIWELIAIGGVLTLATLALLWFIAAQITRPIRRLTRVTQSIADGDLDAEASVETRDETGVLATAFNSMVGNLRQLIETERTAQEMASCRAAEVQAAKERLEAVVGQYMDFVEQVAEGNLSTRLALDTPENGDVLIALGSKLNRMVHSLQTITIQMHQASDSIVSAVADILSATTQQSASTSEQSSAISQATTAVEQVKSIASQTAQQAGQLASESDTLLSMAKSGTQAVEATVRGMGKIHQQVETIAQTILALAEQTQAIGEITTTVSELADQSNLLALNAAIEAARAGAQGKSFAVVAQQVRDLAERSKAATVQVQTILGEIQRATNTAVMVTEEGSKGVATGVRLSGEAGGVIHQIATEVERGAQANLQMAAAAHQQMSGMEQIAQAMNDIQQSARQARTSTQQAERAAQALKTLSQSLLEAIEQYRV